jgi:predicted methyltransferase
MSCAQHLLSLFLLSPCTDNGGGLSDQAIAAAVANPARLEQDLLRDAGRKPAEVLNFFGIKEGMTVLEMFAGGGYYTEILNHLVGTEGKVLAHNNQAYIAYTEATLKLRDAEDRLGNVERITAEADDLVLAENSLDAALLVLTWHDFFFSDDSYDWPDVDEQGLLNTLCHAMKPGAVLGVVDHIANPGGDVAEIAKGLHRIDPKRVKADFEESCFELVAESDILFNPEDDHTLPMSAQGIRGNTDRFVFRYVRRDG